MASSQELIDTLYNQGTDRVNKLKEQRTQSDAEFIKQVQDAIDQSAAAAAKPYQTQIDQLPSQYQELYDTNAVQELVNRRQVQETMANMGLTDSGLNRTQQTAIALQKGNADAAARLQQQQKTQELQDKIAQLMESAAAQKQQQEAEIRHNTNNWYNNMLAETYNNAVTQGTSQYNAEQDRAFQEKQTTQQLQAAAEQAALDRQHDLTLAEKERLAALDLVDAEKLANLALAEKERQASLELLNAEKQAALEEATKEAEAAIKKAELEAQTANAENTAKAQQQVIDNNMKVIELLSNAGFSQEDVVSYMKSAGLISDGEDTSVATGGATQTTPESRGQYLYNEITGHRMTAEAAVEDIIKTFSGDVASMRTAAQRAGVKTQLYDTIAANIDTSKLDDRTKYSAEYRGQYLSYQIASGKMGKEEALADIMDSFKGNDAAMKVAAEKAGVLYELMERYE